jgi:hypothetical protein
MVFELHGPYIDSAVLGLNPKRAEVSVEAMDSAVEVIDDPGERDHLVDTARKNQTFWWNSRNL